MSTAARLFCAGRLLRANQGEVYSASLMCEYVKAKSACAGKDRSVVLHHFTEGTMANIERESQPANDPDWRKLELLVASIQKKLAPNARVEHNVKLEGRITGVNRQIDVLLRDKIGQYEMMFVIDTKDYKVKVDTKGVEEFYGLINDVGAHKGVLVSPSGFTPAAHKTAERYQIELYRPVDTGNHKWRARVTAPVLCEYRLAKLFLKISCCYNGPLSLQAEIGALEVFAASGEPLGIVNAAASRLWDAAELPTEPGEHSDLVLFGQEKFVDNGHGGRAPVTLTGELYVEARRYFGSVPLSKLSGFLDDRTGTVIANSFTVQGFSPEMVESKWLLLKEGEEPPVAPLI